MTFSELDMLMFRIGYFTNGTFCGCILLEIVFIFVELDTYCT